MHRAPSRENQEDNYVPDAATWARLSAADAGIVKVNLVCACLAVVKTYIELIDTVEIAAIQNLLRGGEHRVLIDLGHIDGAI